MVDAHVSFLMIMMANYQVCDRMIARKKDGIPGIIRHSIIVETAIQSQYSTFDSFPYFTLRQVLKGNIQATARCSLFKEECRANSLNRPVFTSTCWIQHLFGFFFTSGSSSAISATNTGCADHSVVLRKKEGPSNHISAHLIFSGDMPRDAMSAGFNSPGTYLHCSIAVRVCNNPTQLATYGRKGVEILRRYLKTAEASVQKYTLLNVMSTSREIIVLGFYSKLGSN